MTYWKSSGFRELQQAWYQRLAETGFEDAERLVGDELELRQSSTAPYRSMTCLKRRVRRDDMGEVVRVTRREINITARYAKEQYFHVVSALVQDTTFRNEVDRLVVVRYAEGRKACEICEELKQRGTPRFRHAIRFIVRRYETLWGLKKWTPRQLGKKTA